MVKVNRLNYIGSKFQLLEWITGIIKEKTSWDSFENKRIADLFSGTGIVSYHFRMANSIVFSNDVELYSSIITHAFTLSVYTDTIKQIINQIQTDLSENKHSCTVGFITLNYSPYDKNERMFFTVENAKRIDYIRDRLENLKNSITIDEYYFLLASLIISADSISNVPAVYGCFLKKFKSKAIKDLIFKPIHELTVESAPGSSIFHSDILDSDFLSLPTLFDLVYLDPPYNERQYSKNYFPLNIIAKTPDELLSEPPLKGKTGIPTDCFISPFCKKKNKIAEESFDKLFKELKTEWLFMSYNSESIVSKDKILELMQKYGSASVVERDYKRFKSYEYNEDLSIKEYLFCLHKQ